MDASPLLTGKIESLEQKLKAATEQIEKLKEYAMKAKDMLAQQQQMRN